MQSEPFGHSLFEVHCGVASVDVSQKPVPEFVSVALQVLMRASIWPHCAFVEQT